MSSESLEDTLQSQIDKHGDFPILRETSVGLMNVTDSEDTSASDVARIVLQDQSYTANLLKVANSSYYSLSDSKINTVSKAVVMLGLDEIRNISLELSFVDMFQKHHPGIDMKKIVTNSFIAATIAKEIAVKIGHPKVEEVFTNALMYNMGPIATAYYMPEKYLKIDDLIDNLKMTPLDAQKEVLGHAFSDIGITLAKKWNLPDSIVKTLESSTRQLNSKATNFQEQMNVAAKLANDITYNLFNENGTEEDFKKVILGLKKTLGLDPRESLKLLDSSYKKVMQKSSPFNIEAEKFKPSSVDSVDDSSIRGRTLKTLNSSFRVSVINTQKEGVKKPIAKAQPTKHQLQLEILREISSILYGENDISVLFNTILEGIHKGIGFDRVMLALCNQDKSKIAGRYSVGIKASNLYSIFNIPNAENNNIFGHCYANQKPIFVKNIRDKEISRLIPQSLRAILKTDSFVISPIETCGTVIGFFYADNAPSDSKITDEEFQSFLHFALQANIGLDRHASKS